MIPRRSPRQLLRYCPVLLISLAFIPGCGDGSGGVDPNIKVEQGKGVQESVKGRGTPKQEPAPLQRKAGGPQ